MLNRTFGNPSLCLAACAFLLLSACTSKEQALKDKQATLEKFASSVAHDLLDRNPETVRVSTMRLMREELHESAADKLQSQKLMPDTEISILKIVQLAQKNHTTNEVKIEKVTAMAPIEKPLVPMKVTGTVVNMVDGKPSGETPFSMTVVCRLTPEMSNYPQVMDVSGLGDRKVAEKQPEANGKKRKHR